MNQPQKISDGSFVKKGTYEMNVSITILVWMTIICTIIHQNIYHVAFEYITYDITMLCCVLSILIEAGSIESGKPSKLRRPTQALSLVLFMIYVIYTEYARITFSEFSLIYV